MVAFSDSSQEQGDRDDQVLKGVGLVAGIGIGILVFFSFAPVFILAVIIAVLTVWTNNKRYLTYGVYASIALLIILLFTGTWRAIFQFTPWLFELLDINIVSLLEDYLNQGQSFHTTFLTYVYALAFAVIFARIGVFFYQRFQSRLVQSDKDGQEKNERTQKYKNVQKNWMKLNAKMQNKWRRKQQKKNYTDEVLLGIDQMGEQVSLSYDELKQHTLAVGTTGSGKTTALYTLLETALHNQDGFVMIDGKGDPETIEQVQSMFDAYGRKLHVFHSSRNLTYNPFKNGGYTAGTNHLFNAFDWSEQFYKNVTKEHTQNVIAFLDAYQFPRDLKHIGYYLELENISNVLRNDTETKEDTEIQYVQKESDESNDEQYDDLDEFVDAQPENEQSYEEKEVIVTYNALSDRAKKYMKLFFGQEEAEEQEINDIIKNMNGDLKRFIRGMSSQLNYIVNSEIGYLFEEKEDSIDLADIIAKGEGVIFSLNTMSYPDFILRLGRFIIDDVSTVIQEQGQNKKNSVLGIFDEFDSYGNERITDILAKSRSANFRAVISIQSLAQLKLDEGDITQKVIDTCNTYLIGQTNDPNNAEYAANLIGTQEDEEQTIMTKEIGPGFGRLDYKSDMGTIRKVRNYYFHPDDIKELTSGRFIINRKAADAENDNKRAFIYFRNPIDGLETTTRTEAS